jgi:hypothetical protein
VELDNADDEDSGDEHEPSLGWSSSTDQHLALADVGTVTDVCFLDGEQDSHDAEPDVCDGETVMWGDDLKSQEVLVHLG